MSLPHLSSLTIHFRATFEPEDLVHLYPMDNYGSPETNKLIWSRPDIHTHHAHTIQNDLHIYGCLLKLEVNPLSIYRPDPDR